MAEMVQEKNAGLKFAEEQLLRHGWEKGKGLGRSENGISEAIKVKVKCDKGGMGHKEGEQFSFHWWDHVFNKASSGLVVETGQDGVMVKKSGDDSDGLISNKKPRKAQQAKSMLYGCFVKSATLLSGEEHPEKSCDPEDSSSSSSSSEDEDQKLDLSTTTKLSDADLLKACGGRTAHKGARHGLTMSAKLARLEEQEQQFMNKYGKKSHTAETSTNNTEHLNLERPLDVKEKTKHKKSKKQELSENNIHDTENDKPKKTKDFNDPSTEPKKKKKRNRKEKAALDDCPKDINEDFAHTLPPITDSIKKKKKPSKVVSNTEDYIDAHDQPPQEGSTEHQQTSDSVSKKRKKKKKSVHQETFRDMEDFVNVTEDTNNEAQIMDMQTEGQENNRKKRKKRKNEEQEKVENVPKNKQQRMNLCDI